jgi:hypothetical protein
LNVAFDSLLANLMVSGTPSAATGASLVPGRAQPARRREHVVLALSLLAFALLAARVWPHTVDDAFISFRYARNCTEGHGLVFNPGERVEGYTNFLWVVLLALGIKLGVTPEWASRLLGLAAAAGTIAVVAQCAARRMSPVPAMIAPVLLALHPALSVWATGGLETALFGFLVTWGACRVVDEMDGAGVTLASAVIVALAALTRPEGAAVGVVLSAVIVLLGGRSSAGRRRWAVWTAAFIAVWAPYFLWRWSFYGRLLPNTFYAKVDLGGAQIARGLAYAHEFGKVTGYWLLPLLGGLVYARPVRPVVVLGSLVAVFSAYTIYVGGDGLPMYRFFVPVLGPLMILAALGCEGWWSRFGHGKVLVGVGAVVFAAAAASLRPHFAGRDFEYVRQDIREVDAWRKIGLWFKDHAVPGASLAVLPAGAMPYYSQFPTLDLLGLNDVTIAHTAVAMGRGQAGHEKFNLGYVLSRAPTYIVVGVYGLRAGAPRVAVDPYYPIEFALLRSPEFQAHYRPVVAETPDGFFTFFARID